MTRAERVQKIAETIAAYEAARDRLDRMTRVKFQICAQPMATRPRTTIPAPTSWPTRGGSRRR